MRYDNIQVLRVLAAGLVVLTHGSTHIGLHLGPGSMPSPRFGVTGVDVFFAISGFIMTVTVGTGPGGPGDWRSFAWRRITKIVPLYWLCTALDVALDLMRQGAGGLPWLWSWHAAASFLILPTYNPGGAPFPLLDVGWTLTFEMLFYALFTLVLACRARPILWVPPILLACAAVSRRDLGFLGDFRIWFDPILLEFALGMAVGMAVLGGWRLGRRSALVLGALALASLPASELFGDVVFINDRTWIVGPPAAALVFAAASLEGRVRLPLRAPLMTLAAGSYALYLIHYVIAMRLLGPVALLPANLAVGCVLLLLFVAVSVAAALALHRWIERPVQRLLRDLVAGRPRPSPAEGVASAVQAGTPEVAPSTS